MKILPDDFKIPSNPHTDDWIRHIFSEGQQSILSQMKDVDLDEMVTKWCEYQSREVSRIEKLQLKNDALFTAFWNNWVERQT